MAKHTRIILSDTHIGAGFAEAGNALEDFTSDAEFVDLLHDLVEESNNQNLDMELIFAGDFLEMLQVPTAHPFDPYEHYPPPKYSAADVESVLTKMEQIFEGHPGVWAGMSDFLSASSPRRVIRILWGNHDPELYWPEVQNRVREALNATGEFAGLVRFHTHIEERNGVYVEHGNQYAERFNRLTNFVEPLDPHDETRIEHPPGSRFVISFVNEVERERPWINNVHPMTGLFWYGLQYDFHFAVRALAALLREAPILLREDVAVADAGEAGPLLLELEDPERVEQLQKRYGSDPAFRFEFHQRIIRALDDAGLDDPPPEPVVTAAEGPMTAHSIGEYIHQRGLQVLRDAAARKAEETGAKVVVFGHVHVPEVTRLSDEVTYANCGTWIWNGDFSKAGPDLWRDLFENPEKYSEQRDLTYIRVDHDDAGQLHTSLQRYGEAPPPIGEQPETERPGCLGMLWGRR